MLDRFGQLRIIGTAGLEISAHHQHHHSRRCLFRALPDSGGRVQGTDERSPLLLIGASGVQLLELVDDQKQPRLLPVLWTSWLPGRPASLGQGSLTRGQGEPGRIGL